MRRLSLVALVIVMLLAAIAPVVVNATPASACTEGLTPGYWKNHTEAWVGLMWRGNPVTPTTKFVDVMFAGTDYPALAAKSYFPRDPSINANITLMQALQLGGGGEKAFLRHATAALLNSASDIDYWGEKWVLDRVSAAYWSGNFEKYKNLLESYNQMGVNGD